MLPVIFLSFKSAYYGKVLKGEPPGFPRASERASCNWKGVELGWERLRSDSSMGLSFLICKRRILIFSCPLVVDIQ